MNIRASNHQLLPIIGILILGLFFILAIPAGSALEEVQAGGNGFYIINQQPIPLEFAGTNLVAAAGLHLGGHTLSGLRMGFIALALLGWALLFHYFSAGKAGGAFTFTYLLTAAISTPFLLAGYLADELCFGTTLLILFVACTLRFSERPSNLSSAFIGFLAGCLIYEYISYKLALLFYYLTFLIVLWRAEGSIRSKVWHGALSITTALLVALPALDNLLTMGSNSFLLDGPNRHRDLVHFSWAFFWNRMEIFAQFLFGISTVDSLFSSSSLPALAWPLPFLAAGLAIVGARRNPLLLVFLSHVLISTGIIAATGSNIEYGRLLPTLLSLIVAGAIALERSVPSKTSRAFILALVLGATCLYQAWVTAEFVTSRAHRANHSHDDYFTCTSLQRTAQITGAGRILFVALNDFAACPTVGSTEWLFPAGASVDFVLETQFQISPCPAHASILLTERDGNSEAGQARWEPGLAACGYRFQEQISNLLGRPVGRVYARNAPE